MSARMPRGKDQPLQGAPEMGQTRESLIGWSL